MTPHISQDLLRQFVAGALSPAERSELFGHAASCATCAENLANERIVAAALAAFESSIRTAEFDDHLSYAECSDYVDGRLDAEAVRHAEAHLKTCVACRTDVADLRDAARQLVPVRSHYVWRIAAAAAFLAVIGAMAFVLVSRRREDIAAHQPASRRVVAVAPPTVAVLPLQNLSRAGADEFLSVGIADALAVHLERTTFADVMPVASVVKISAPARQHLRTDRLIVGEYRSDGERVRVDLRMLDPRSGAALWSDSIQGQRRDLQTLTDTAGGRAAAILDAACSRYAIASRPQVVVPAAYEEYMRARSFAGVVPQNHRPYIAALERAVALDPRFAAAHADLAIALAASMSRGLSDDEETLHKAAVHAGMAVALDPDLAAAHVALGRVLVRQHDGYPQAMNQIVLALGLNSADTGALSLLARYFASVGDIRGARAVSDRIHHVDPWSLEDRTSGYIDLAAADPAAALTAAAAAVHDPAFALPAHDIRGQAYAWLNDLHSAEVEARALLAIAPEHYSGSSLMAMVAAARGDRASAEAWLQRFHAEALRNHFAAVRVALCFARLGDQKRALQWVEQAVRLGNHDYYWFEKHPWFESLRRTNDFKNLMNRIDRDLRAVHPAPGVGVARPCATPPPRSGSTV